MREEQITQAQDTLQVDTFKLYSQKAISIATFLGSPLVAGILARQNFINLGQKRLGKIALILGILSTILLFAGILLLPESVLDKIPNALIPLFYTGIIYLAIDEYQGTAIDEHKENNKPFYSVWRAAGIGVIGALIIVGGIFGYNYMFSDNFNAEKYNTGLDTFFKNEEKTLQLVTVLESGDSAKIIYQIDNVAIPAWNENIAIIDDLDKIENLSKRFKEQNDILRHYSELRIEAFELMKKATMEDSDNYNMQIYNLNNQMGIMIKKLEDL